MHLRTVAGTVELTAWQGQDPHDRHWGIPIREAWGLSAHQAMSVALQDKLAFTATLAGSYEAASQLAGKWGCAVDASVIHTLVQRLGERAETQTQQRLEQGSAPAPQQSQRHPSELAVLMMDGWFARFRGPGWGRKKTPKERVEWHEIKTGIFYLQEQAAHTQGGRGWIAGKRVVRCCGEPMELGRRLHDQALRGGLAAAKEKLVLGDGIPWIWNLKAQRWAGARELLDFWHGSQHLWALARTKVGGDETRARAWVEPRLHQLRHGKEKAVLKEIVGIKRPPGQVGEELRKQQNYFAGQAGRMNYQAMARRGWPIGSGPVESTCRQDQCRFKRVGQFWTQPGFRNLSALDEARHNGCWEALWSIA